MNDPLGLISGSGGVRPTPNQRPTTPQEQAGGSFKDLLLENLKEVNQLQTDASEAVQDLQSGKRDDVETVLAATAKADLAFRMLLQVRNKVMDSYNELKDVRV